MKQIWNEIQPADRYQVALNGLLQDYDQKVISLLYQPLIGPQCYSLYMTLWNEVEINRLWSEDWNHYHLMNFLSMNLSDIYEARLKLEGIGLLKTFIKTSGDIRTFIYELQPPLSPEQFFNDGLLNVFLYRQLGRTHFLRLKNFFSDRAVEPGEYREITRSFQDVYAAKIGPEVLNDTEAQELSRLEKNRRYIGKNSASAIKIENTHFNFDILYAGLRDAVIPLRAITPEVKEAIVKLSFLYDINELEMKQILLSALTPEQEIRVDELRKTARDWYQIEHSEELPRLIDRLQPEIYKSDARDEGKTQEEKLIHYLENTSPRQMLIDFSGGSEPSKADLTAIEDVMFAQQLPPGVMNVLIQYVLFKTDMKLSKSYLEKVASHWARKKLKTVKEAMELAIKEDRQYKQWMNDKENRAATRRKPIRTEKLPDWFEQETINKTAAVAEDGETLEEKRKRLEKIREQYKKG
ncbi:replication initiation and membrane attachment protein [Weizmannia acidilactici]|uniref:Replication initiation and membrane attachment protein n=1 Tax=Weizmannia acidilactici TaxID=2607726 RepID=A0A5J4JMG6_9BACI|nr:DnaD domain protein [Weizmannia acidilactici]GER70184.1 replication initiation and membrane attachment protein [Weizmannia acidilactici]GER73256.1 replication initiation and membrane attachment protein [Weizmannia acidilactici]